MEWMFGKSVEGIIELINQQLVQLDRKRLRIKTVFLSGGFSQSKYLQRQVNGLTDRFRFTLLSGANPWTAVAKGGAMMGLGIGCEVPSSCIKCPIHIGIVISQQFKEFDHKDGQKYTDSFENKPRARGAIKWLIAKGDLVEHNRGIEKSIKVIKKLAPTSPKSGGVFIIATSRDNWPDNELPGRFVANDYGERNSTARPALGIPQKDGQADRNIGQDEVINLSYNLGDIPMDTRKRTPDKYIADRNAAGMTFHRVEMEVEISVSRQGARLDLLWGKQTGLGGTGAPGFRLNSRSIEFPL
jgi:hypothetical protein